MFVTRDYSGTISTLFILAEIKDRFTPCIDYHLQLEC